MARLVFYRGPRVEGEPPLLVYRLRNTRTRIGRVDDCDVVLPDDEVSRSHCLIDERNGAWVLTDRSSNGTWRNGERVSTCALAEGDMLRFGPFHARFEVRSNADAPPTEEAQPERRDEELLSGGEQLAVAEAWLRISHGPGEGQRFRLRGSRISVGAVGSRVVLPDATLVRDHVRIRLAEGRTMVEPGQGAAFVGATRVREILPLYPAEEVRVGATEFSISWDLREDLPRADRFGEMVGSSDAMRLAFGMLRRMAAHHAPVLLLGESGTGKELAARALHDASPRAGAPFVALNCGAITSTLFESELFGYERGAFTGASDRRDGAFQRADGGTLFLDEIGELPEEAQVKLLRTLESGEVRRVGGRDAVFPDVRVLAATNRNLIEAVADGSFRGDLYFRLAVLAVRLPPLRERREEIPLLAETIGKRVHPEMRITPAAMEALRAHAWPGNARELRNVLTRAYVLFGPLIDLPSLSFNPLEASSPIPPHRSPIPPSAIGPARRGIEDAEREVVVDALNQAGGNRTTAARLLGVPRSTLLYKLRRWGLE